MKKLISLAAACLIVSAMLPMATASAAPTGAAAAACHAVLGVWPTPGGGGAFCGQGDLTVAGQGEGYAYGVFVPGPVCVPNCPFFANVDGYSEPCFAAEPPLTGTASGTLNVGGFESRFSWTRVGLVAVLTLDGTGGAGVAAFVPDVGPGQPLPTCDAPGRLEAHVAGVALHL